MQFSGGFSDQDLWVRKTDNIASRPWSKILMEDSNGKVSIGGRIGYDKFTITGRHHNSTILLQADNDGNPNAYLSLWASEPQSTYTGVGIGNNVRNYDGSKAFARINNAKGGSYIRLLENEIFFNLVDNSGNVKTPLILAGNGQVNFSNAAVAPVFISATSSNEGGVLILANYSKLEATEVKVTTSPTADFVFEEHYKLPSLEEVEAHIKTKKHLPEIASAKEMEKEGVNIGEFQIQLLQKIEELTLYSIEQNKQLKMQNEEINNLKLELKTLKNKK